MDDFESKLGTIPLTKPSSDLRRRIFGSHHPKYPVNRIFPRRIPLAWAAVFALVTAAMGFWGGRYFEDQTVNKVPTVVEIQITGSPSSHNAFDFTTTSRDFLRGEVNVQIETDSEV